MLKQIDWCLVGTENDARGKWYNGKDLHTLVDH